MTRRQLSLLLTVLLLAVPPAPAWAGASRPGYENVPGAGGEGGFGRPAPTESAAEGGSLPFSGLDLLTMAMFGAGVLSMGLLIRRTRHV